MLVMDVDVDVDVEAIGGVGEYVLLLRMLDRLLGEYESVRCELPLALRR